jgi:enoyl-CoA hydratase/carnithine racemase
MSYENIAVEKDGAIGIVTLNRSQAMNALSYKHTHGATGIDI